MDGGAWWAAVYGVTQSRTRLKWLSSSNIPLNTCTSFLTLHLLMDTKLDILTASVILPARKQGAHLFQTFYSQRRKSELALSEVTSAVSTSLQPYGP